MKLQWVTFLDSEGRVMDSKALRKRIFYGGIEHKLRREVCVAVCEEFYTHHYAIFVSFAYFHETLDHDDRFGPFYWDIMHMNQHVLRESILGPSKSQNMRP